MKNFSVGEIVFWTYGLANGFGVVSEILEEYKIIPESHAGTCYKVIHVYETFEATDFHYENSLTSIPQLNFVPNAELEKRLLKVQKSLSGL